MKTSRNFRKIKQPMDGNCFFHSLSTLLKYHDICDFTHKKIRKIISKYHKNNGKYEQATNISSLGAWAETIDVIAASHVFKVTLKVWETKNNMWITFGKYKKKLYLYNEEMIHFDALIPVS